jgi:hypothetical protein
VHRARKLPDFRATVSQFLSIAGDVFDLVLMAAVLKKPLTVSPKRQDDIVRAAARRLVEAIPRKVPHGSDVRSLLDAIGSMSVRETYRSTAPYPPGVNAFAISMEEFALLRDERFRRQQPGTDRFAKALTAAVWNNLLQLDVDYACKGKRWAVFYLNRLLCANYGLPLNYGGFREKKLSVVRRWVTGQLDDDTAPTALGLS